MIVNCEIKFNKPDKIYHSGDTLSGRIEIDITQRIKVKKVYVLICGLAETKWHESKTRTDSHGKTHTDSHFYTGKEKYFETVVSLLEEDDIFPGTYSYNFSCSLYPNLPSSTNEPLGKIKYSATVIINRPWKFDLKFPFDFTVIQPFDLGHDPTLMIPIQQEVIKTFCCLFCETKPVIVTANLPASGFIPGENTRVSIKLDNPTNVTIECVEVSLIKNVIYRSQCPHENSKKEEYCRHKVSTGEPLKDSSATYEILFTIPQTVPSSRISHNRLINIFYEIHVKAVAQGCHQSPLLKFPITIGTIHSDSSSLGFQNYRQTPTAPILYDDFYSPDPPSFEEAIRMNAVGNVRPIGFDVPQSYSYR